MATIPLVRQPEPVRALSWQAVAFTERIVAALMLALAAPVVLTSGLVLSLFSRRSPLIAHKRVGWLGAPLWVLKLRTMWDGAAGREQRTARWIEQIDDEVGPDLKEAGDPRVANAFARFCRRHSIDEIPQLWHVVTGQMSLVGPRPMTAAELRRYYGPDADEILQVKPGLAGLWQVSGRNRLNYAQRRALDLQLVRTRSVRMYLSLLLRTIPEVLGGANSW